MKKKSDLSEGKGQGFIPLDLKHDLVSALKKSAEYFNGLVDLLPVCLLMAKDGKIIYVNQASLHLLGYQAPEQLVGLPVAHFVAPSSRASLGAGLGGPGKVRDGMLEIEALKKSGEKIYIEGETIAVVREGLPAVLMVFRDITSRKTIDVAARLSDENFEAVIREMPESILVVDKNEVLIANRALARMLGFSSMEELNGRPAFDLFHPDSRSLIRERVEGILDNEASNSPMRVKLTGKGGDPVSAEYSGIVVQFRGKWVALMVLRDMSPQIQMEKQAGQTSKWATVGILTSRIVQEINNPLTDIVGNLSFLEDRSKELRAYLEQKGVLDDACEALFVGIKKEARDIAAAGEKIRAVMSGLKLYTRPDNAGTDKSLVWDKPEMGRVVVVDDEPGNLDILCRVLRKHNEILPAASGSSAMDILEKEGGKVEAIVTDINMPGMNGITFYQRVAERFPGLEKKIVFVTGGVFDREAKRFLDKVPNLCLEKPFEFETLRRAVSQWDKVSSKN